MLKIRSKISPVEINFSNFFNRCPENSVFPECTKLIIKKKKQLKNFWKFFFTWKKQWGELFCPGKIIGKNFVGKYISRVSKFWLSNCNFPRKCSQKINFDSVWGSFQWNHNDVRMSQFSHSKFSKFQRSSKLALIVSISLNWRNSCYSKLNEKEEIHLPHEGLHFGSVLGHVRWSTGVAAPMPKSNFNRNA